MMQIMLTSQVSSTYINVSSNTNDRSIIGNHSKGQHGNEPEKIERNFKSLMRKCANKLDCLIFENTVFYIDN